MLLYSYVFYILMILKVRKYEYGIRMFITWHSNVFVFLKEDEGLVSDFLTNGEPEDD
jgi:hypothetical protein